MMWRNFYSRNRFGRRNIMRPAFRMRNDFPGLHWDFALGGTSGPLQSRFPLVNVWEGDQGTIVSAEVPGVNPDDMDISVKDNILTIAGSRNSEELPNGASFNRRERGYGEFSRTIKLGYEVNADDVSATFENGVLRIELPRMPEEKPKKIEVKSNS